MIIIKYIAVTHIAKFQAYPNTAVIEKLNNSFLDFDQNQRGGISILKANIPNKSPITNRTAVIIRM